MIKDLADVQHKLDHKLTLVMKHSGILSVAVMVDYSINNCGNLFGTQQKSFYWTCQNILFTNILLLLNIFNILSKKIDKFKPNGQCIHLSNLMVLKNN